MSESFSGMAANINIYINEISEMEDIMNRYSRVGFGADFIIRIPLQP